MPLESESSDPQIGSQNVEDSTDPGPVLRIHLILTRIRILNPHWKKMDPDPGHEHLCKIYRFFSLIFLQQLDELFIQR